jgi:hypothetical protein
VQEALRERAEARKEREEAAAWREEKEAWEKSRKSATKAELEREFQAGQMWERFKNAKDRVKSNHADGDSAFNKVRSLPHADVIFAIAEEHDENDVGAEAVYLLGTRDDLIRQFSSLGSGEARRAWFSGFVSGLRASGGI